MILAIWPVAKSAIEARPCTDSAGKCPPGIKLFGVKRGRMTQIKPPPTNTGRFSRHSRFAGMAYLNHWIPAFAGMTTGMKMGFLPFRQPLCHACRIPDLSPLRHSGAGRNPGGRGQGINGWQILPDGLLGCRACVLSFPLRGNGLSKPLDSSFRWNDDEETRRIPATLISTFCGMDFEEKVCSCPNGTVAPPVIPACLLQAGRNDAVVKTTEWCPCPSPLTKPRPPVIHFRLCPDVHGLRESGCRAIFPWPDSGSPWTGPDRSGGRPRPRRCGRRPCP